VKHGSGKGESCARVLWTVLLSDLFLLCFGFLLLSAMRLVLVDYHGDVDSLS
jgi:hypothetical protein